MADRRSGGAVALGRVVWAVAGRAAALAVLIVYAPALMLVAVAVIATSDGPAFVSRPYRRPNGDVVDLWEFRTEGPWGWHPTTVGRVIRSLSLHRTPALVNVLLGHVGPGENVRAHL